MEIFYCQSARETLVEKAQLPTDQQGRNADAGTVEADQQGLDVDVDQ